MRGVGRQCDPSINGKGEHGWEELEAGKKILNSCNLKKGQELSFRWWPSRKGADVLNGKPDQFHSSDF